MEPEGIEVHKRSTTALMRHTNLLDILQHQHSDTGDASRENPLNIDHVPITKDLLLPIKQSSFLPWNQIMELDQQTRFVGFDQIELFG